METMTSYLVEDSSCKYSSNEEEEEDESQGDEEDAPVKEESFAQRVQRSWDPLFFYIMDKEVHHFVGQDILIEEALDSFAASTWPAITALCQYLESHCKELDLVDKAVLDIGSGNGLVSIVAALLGAWVTATDFPDVLNNLRLNLSKNTRGKCRHTPQAAALSWSFDLERTYPTSVYHYDYVVAADIVYYDLISKPLATMKHFCQPGTTILWANKVRADTDIEFEERFRAMFNTKLVFEDGDTRIFMATHREEEEEQYVEEGSVNAEMLRVKTECELQMEDKKERAEGTGVRRKKHIRLRDESGSKELVDDERDEGFEDNEKEGGDEGEEAVEGPDPDSKEDTTGQSSLTVEEDSSRDNRDSKDEIIVVDDEKDGDEEEEEEEEESRDVNEQAAVSPGPYNKDDTTGEQQTVKTFSWAASVMSSYGKDTYHYVGTDIDIYECINFNESADPYGAVMWPGALALCSFLENNRDMVNLEDKRVLELGSGTGLVAIVASLLGAKVTATDLPNFLGNLRANVMRNIKGRSRYIPQICPLSWSFDVGRIYPSRLHRFDFVLAADVVYHHHYLAELLATMSHFCHPRTTIIWANKLRIVTDIEFMEKFKKEFDTTLLAEDGDMKIFMGKLKM